MHYPTKHTCYPAYEQGPCENGDILVLGKTSAIPACVRNQCGVNNVMFNGTCSKLNAEDACKKFQPYIGFKVLLVIDPATLLPTCADEDFKYECNSNCCIGSKRYIQNICQPK